MDLTPNVVHETTDTSEFKILIGNRPINQQDVDEIKEAIKNGFDYTKYVIDINEKVEIWDGQHRFTALKDLGLPVRYIVTDGAGIDDCISKNAHQHSWTLETFIRSFASRGNKDYMALHDIMIQYDSIPVKSILRIIARLINRKNSNLIKYLRNVKVGEFYLTDDVFEKVVEELDYLKTFDLVRKKNHHGNSDTFYNALSLCFECQTINNERMFQRLSEYTDRFGSYNSLEECLDRLQTIYNLHSHNKMFIASEINRMLYENRKGA